jgi:spore coat protein H
VRKGYSAMRRILVFTVGLLAFISGSVAATELPNRSPQPPRPKAPGAELFAGTNVWAFSITIDSLNMQSLRRQPRAWAKGTVLLGKETYPNVGIHIKGSQGSLQAIDERPSLTLSFNKFVAGRRCHGLRKLHLNNTAEDPSFMTEVLCGELCRQAGLPAARAGHATLQLNGQRLGLYVVKEGLTTEFLAQYFRRTDGNLYDGGFQKDVDQVMERIHGDGPDEQKDRLALVDAAWERDPARQWKRLQEVLDIDRFISLLAITTLTWNWDGYPMARNNYRIYHDPETDKLVFIPHGLDQMFWEPQGTIYPRMNALVAAAVLRIPEARQLYRQRLAQLHADIFQENVLTNRVNELAALIQPYLPNAFAQAAKLRQQISGRAKSVAEQLGLPEPQPMTFVDNEAALKGWNRLGASAVAVLDELRVETSRSILRIRATARTTAGWITRVWLPAGTYEFSARVKAHQVVGSGNDRNSGVGVHSTASRLPTRRLMGDSEWEDLRCRLVVRSPEAIVEFLCELRSASGEAWFDLDSLKLRRLGDGRGAP